MGTVDGDFALVDPDVDTTASVQTKRRHNSIRHSDWSSYIQSPKQFISLLHSVLLFLFMVASDAHLQWSFPSS